MKFKIREMVVKEFVKTPWRKELFVYLQYKRFSIKAITVMVNNVLC